MYVGTDSAGVHNSNGNTWNVSNVHDQQANLFKASIADSGDIVFQYGTNVYLKHLSDGSGTLESVAKNTLGAAVNVNNGVITTDGKYIFFQADPYVLGLTSSPSSSQIIRTKSNL